MSRSRSQSLTKWSIFASPRSCRTPIPPPDLMLAPLSEGKHSLHFTGTFPQFNFAINVTYNLTVRRIRVPMRGTGVELACFYWVAPPIEAGHRLAFLGHHHEREAPRAQTSRWSIDTPG